MPHQPALYPCEDCGYALDGIEQCAGMVVCPECGRRQRLVRSPDPNPPLSWIQALVLIAIPMPVLLGLVLPVRIFTGPVSVVPAAGIGVLPLSLGLLIAVGISGSIGPIQSQPRGRRFRMVILAWLCIYAPVMLILLI